MAIYKLSNIIGFVRGNSIFQKKDLKSEGEYLGLHYGKTYKFNIINNNFPYLVSKSFYKKNQVIQKNDSIMIITSEIVCELGKIVFYNSEKKGIARGEQIKLFPKDENKLLKKYLFYWFYKNNNILKRFATGIKVFRIKGNDLKFIEGYFPNINQQQKIIDIIEPIRKCIHLAEKIMNLIKEKLKLKYLLCQNDTIYFSDLINLYAVKYNNQKIYFATNGFGEFLINYSKIQDILIDKPSRANLSPMKNSLIISKLLGENKIMYFSKNPKYVVSTGFYNFQSNYLDYIAGFLLSNDFIKQKNIFSSGTIMVGLNKDGLNKIKIKKPSYEGNKNLLLFSKLIDFKNKCEILENSCVKLLIK